MVIFTLMLADVEIQKWKLEFLKVWQNRKIPYEYTIQALPEEVGSNCIITQRYVTFNALFAESAACPL